MPPFYAPQPSAPPPGSPYLSPLQAFLGGAAGGYQNAQAAQAAQQQAQQQAAAAASLRLQLGALANQGKQAAPNERMSEFTGTDPATGQPLTDSSGAPLPGKAATAAANVAGRNTHYGAQDGTAAGRLALAAALGAGKGNLTPDAYARLSGGQAPAAPGLPPAPPLSPPPDPAQGILSDPLGLTAAGGALPGRPAPAAAPANLPPPDPASLLGPAAAAGIAGKASAAHLADVRASYIAGSQTRATDARTLYTGAQTKYLAGPKTDLTTEQANLTGVKATDQPGLDHSLISLRGAQGKLYTSAAGKNAAEIPTIGRLADSLVGLRGAQGAAATENAATNASRTPILQQNANTLRQNADTAAARVRGGGGNGQGALNSQVRDQQSVIDKNNAQKNSILRGLMSRDGVQRQPTQIEKNMIDAHDFNIQAAQHQQNALRAGQSGAGNAPGGVVSYGGRHFSAAALAAEVARRRGGR